MPSQERGAASVTLDTIASTICGIGDVRHAKDDHGDAIMLDDWITRADRLITQITPLLQEMKALRATVPDDTWKRATS